MISGRVEELLGSLRYEVVARTPLTGVAFDPVAGGFRTYCADSAAAQTLTAALINAGIEVLRMQRERRSLEELFFADEPR
jgi:hypothetical protein